MNEVAIFLYGARRHRASSPAPARSSPAGSRATSAIARASTPPPTRSNASERRIGDRRERRHRDRPNSRRGPGRDRARRRLGHGPQRRPRLHARSATGCAASSSSSPDPDGRLRGADVVVTGANSGIGAAAAETMAVARRAGSSMVVRDVEQRRGRPGADQRADGKRRPAAAPLRRLGRSTRCRELAAELATELDGIDALVHNAGVMCKERETQRRRDRADARDPRGRTAAPDRVAGPAARRPRPLEGRSSSPPAACTRSSSTSRISSSTAASSTAPPSTPTRSGSR